MSSSSYGGVATSEGESAAASALAAEGLRPGSVLLSSAEGQIAKLKKAALEGRAELSFLGFVGAIAMLVLSLLGIIHNFFALSPVCGLIMGYCVLGSIALIALEAVAVSPDCLSKDSFLMRKFRGWRVSLFQEARFLSTLGGRGCTYVFVGSLMWADSLSWLGAIVGGYLMLLGLLMLFIAHRTRAKLEACLEQRPSNLEDLWARHDVNKDGRLSSAELNALCKDLGTTLTVRELEAALQLLDKDQSGFVDRDEFQAWWSGNAHYSAIPVAASLA